MALVEEIDRMINAALTEDIGAGDITSNLVVPPEATGRGVIKAKCDLVLAGVEAARRTFLTVDERVRFEALHDNGARLKEGSEIARIGGALRSLLAAERTALNFLGRASGVATLTARYVEQVKGTKAKILDTRKTAPGLRALDKAAVRAGGGLNHRMGLFDGVLIKDNHISAAGGVKEAVRRVKKKLPPKMLIEIEVSNTEQLDEALEAGADIIMLDNMAIAEIAAAVEQVAGRAKIEVSGNVTIESVREIARTGVDFISVGALTHSASVADISMHIEKP